jgi:hypothetical protein
MDEVRIDTNAGEHNYDSEEMENITQRHLDMKTFGVI